jgi:hypothetical protein
MEGWYGYLTEAGFHLDDGTVIGEGRLLDIAWEVQTLFETGQTEAFSTLVETAMGDLGENDRCALLRMLVDRDRGITVINEIGPD